jgi:hypothetical protein
MEKKNTTYKCVVLVNIQVAHSLYKLVHATEFLQCNELFAIGKSPIHLVLCEFVQAMNHVFNN